MARFGKIWQFGLASPDPHCYLQVFGLWRLTPRFRSRLLLLNASWSISLPIPARGNTSDPHSTPKRHRLCGTSRDRAARKGPSQIACRCHSWKVAVHFKHDRKLLGLPSQRFYETIEEFFHEVTENRDAVPGAILSVSGVSNRPRLQSPKRAPPHNRQALSSRGRASGDQLGK